MQKSTVPYLHILIAKYPFEDIVLSIQLLDMSQQPPGFSMESSFFLWDA